MTGTWWQISFSYFFVIFEQIKYKLQSFYEINNRLESINTTELFAIASDIYNLCGKLRLKFRTVDKYMTSLLSNFHIVWHVNGQKVR